MTTNAAQGDRWSTLEPKIRALIQGWRQTLGGPPKDRLTYALVQAYDALDRREAQVSKLRQRVSYSAVLEDTLTGLVAERDELRERVADLFERWVEAHPAEAMK